MEAGIEVGIETLSFKTVVARTRLEGIPSFDSLRVGPFLVSKAGTVNPDHRGERLIDSVLDRSGMVLSYSSDLQNPQSSEAHSAAQNTIVAFRLGLSLAIIDKIRSHLSGRVSYGKSTLQHETVMSEVGEFLARISEVMSEIPLEEPLATIALSPQRRAHYHSLLSEGTARGVKLMGGHGYLAGSIGDWGYVSRFLEEISVKGELS